MQRKARDRRHEIDRLSHSLLPREFGQARTHARTLSPAHVPAQRQLCRVQSAVRQARLAAQMKREEDETKNAHASA